MFTEDTREAIHLMMDVYNDRHNDAILFIAKYYFEEIGVTEASLSSFDESKLTLSIKTKSVTCTRNIEFEAEPSNSSEAAAYLLECLSEARNKAPEDEPKTKIEVEIEKNQKLKTYITQVSATKKISSNIIEITFKNGLEDLPNIRNDAFLFFIVPKVKKNKFPKGFSMADYRSMVGQEDQKLFGAYYTVKSFRKNEIDVWFVLHKDPGPLADWASKAELGDHVAVWGPRTSFLPPEKTSNYLFIADETAQPAVLASVENLPKHDDFLCLFETQNMSTQYTYELEKERIEWVYRDSDKAGEGDKLLNRINELDLDVKNLYIFGAGEGKQMSKIRKLLKKKYPIKSNQITLTGYWRKTK